MKKITCILLFLIFSVGILLADSGGQAEYDEAIQFIKVKQDDFAFLKFREIVRKYPESRFAPDALFATGEYCYDKKMYYEAIENFSAYVKNYPRTDAAVFARTYLLKIIEETDRDEIDKEVIENLERELFSKPLFLLFSQYKEASYKSPFRNKFTIRYYMDMIEIYKNDELFIKILQ